VTGVGLAQGVDPVYERILLPITSADTPGVFGALWTTEVWVRNDSDQPVAIFPLTITDATNPPKSTWPLAIFRPPPDAPPGQFIYVSRDRADAVRFNVRVFDANQTDRGFGVEIPVVRERGFFHDRLVLFNIPTGAETRAALRVYGTPDSNGGQVRLRIFDTNGSEPVVDVPMRLQSRVPLFYNPVYAQILSLTTMFPAIRTLERVRVELTIEQGSFDIWAFVTLTSNVTNAITTVTPQ